MDSRWRDGVRPHLEHAGLEVVTNELPEAWGALSWPCGARRLVPLIEHDLSLIDRADAVLWHLGPESITAPVELGLLARETHRRVIVAHVDADARGRRYFKALCLATGVVWAPSWDRAVFALLGALVYDRRRP